MLCLGVAELAKSFGGLDLGVAELAKSFGGLDESTGIYRLKSPKAYAASATQEPQLLGWVQI